MQLTIRNFGPIYEIKFDIRKDLNVLFGKNNIGKSYAIICYYLILKNLSFSNASNPFELTYFYIKNYVSFESEQMPYSIDKIKGEFQKIDKKLKSNYFSKKKKDYKINNHVKELLKVALEESFLVNLQKSFSSSFDSLESLTNNFTSEKFEIKIESDKFNFKFSPSEKFDRLQITSIDLKEDYYLRKIKTNRDTYEVDNELYIYYNNKKNLKREQQEILYRPMMNIFNSFLLEINQNISNIYFLPASRSGLYQALSTFSAIVAELSKSRKFLSEKIELPNISDPVSDYFLYLSNIKKGINDSKFADVGLEFEKEILNGEISVNEESNKIVFKPNSINSELDLSYTSSMVSEIAPIVAFLKYIINDETSGSRHIISRWYIRSRSKGLKDARNLIFIEEPEAHLHPEVQTKLMELFSKLINSNVKIVMTTHSNYIFNKLSNLILGNKIDVSKVDSNLLKLGEKGSFVDKKCMQVDDYGIVDDNFVDISEKLFIEREEYLKDK
ncbi:MAG: AAA family ATPase [Balneolaceae bacterium]